MKDRVGNKTIGIRLSTWAYLNKIKIQMNFKTIDDVIQLLIRIKEGIE